MVRRLVLISTGCRLSAKTRQLQARVARHVREGSPQRAIACLAVGVVLLTYATSPGAAFRELIANGALPAGYATEDGTGLVYAGTALLEAITVLPGKQAW